MPTPIRILFILYITLFSLFINLSGVVSSLQNNRSLLPQIAFLPVVLFLITTTIREIRNLKTQKDVTNNPPFIKKRQLAIALFLLLFLATIGVINMMKLPHQQSTLSPSVPLPTPTPSPLVFEKKKEVKQPKVRIKSNNPSERVNIREQPEPTAKIIGKTRNGEEFIYLEENKDWYKIQLNSEDNQNEFGWIAKELTIPIQE